MAKKAKQENNITNDNPEKRRVVDAWYWAYFGQIKLQGGLFSHENHEYLADPLCCYHPRQYTIKGAQMGFTEESVLKTLHGMIYGRYPVGALHLFPTSDDVTDFAKARFNTLISQNPDTIGCYVRNTDAVNIKQINDAMLYLRGAKQTKAIEGLRKTSSKLKSIPVDRIVYDERDEMDDDMVELALERISHSTVQEVDELSTPTVPDYGIDRSYGFSDQRVWTIKCQHCGKDTCLELTFPNCLQRTRDDRVLRICVHCKKEIYPKDGQWLAQYPDRKDAVGWWISQLNSAYVSPKTILDQYEHLGQPGFMSRQEFYNSKLAKAYVDAENRLTKQDIERCMCIDPMEISHPGPCAMGVDVGSALHVIIGVKANESMRKVLYMGRLSNWVELHDIAKRFGVQVAVIDGEPERHKARDFQKAEGYAIYLCDYQEHQRGDVRWDIEKGDVVGNRTELLDRTHALVTGNTRAVARQFEIPRRSAEIDEFITEMIAIVKVQTEDKKGNRLYEYKKLGADHYRHALVYFDLACQRVDICKGRLGAPVRVATQDVAYDPFSYAHKQSTDYDVFAR